MTSTLSSSSSPWPLPNSDDPNPTPTNPHIASSSQTLNVAVIEPDIDNDNDNDNDNNDNDDSEGTASSAVAATTTITSNTGSTHSAPQVEDSVGSSTLLHISFNQDYGCFTAGTTSGFRIYNCDPFREIYRRVLSSTDGTSGGGIGFSQMLFRSNILVLVGGGPNPQYPLNKVMIWDDHEARCIGELSFRSEVKSVRLRRDRIVVILLEKIYVYNFTDLRLLHQIETVLNPRGLCEISYLTGSQVLVCPGLRKGQVRVEHYASKKTKFIMAHDSKIACFALTNDGRILATASSKGTLVRIFNTLDGSLLQEVRRGADRAEIYSLAFSSSAQWLAVSSDKGTVHVFGLKVDSSSMDRQISRTSSDVLSSAQTAVSHLSFIKGVLPKYFSSEWSVAQFRLPEGLQYLVAFGHHKNTIVILGMDGSFYRCEFDPVAGGEMTQIDHHNFLNPNESF